MIEKSVLLACKPAQAFALFTEQAGAWWPVDRRHTADGESAILFAADGRFFERARDGREVELGRVLAWEPPARLQLSFYVGTDADHPTEVEITFVAEGKGTRVTVKHRSSPSSLALFPLRAPKFAASWDKVLDALASAAKA